MNWQLSDRQLELQARARELANQVIAPRAAEVDRTEEYPWDNVAALQEAWEAALAGVSLAEFALTRPNLRRALEMAA